MTGWFSKSGSVLGAYIVEIALAVILVMALYWFINYDILVLSSIKKLLNSVNQRLKKMKNCTADNLEEIHWLFQKMPEGLIRDMWYEYYMNVTTNRRSDGFDDIRKYFDTESIVNIPGQRKKSDQAPY